MLLVPLDLVDVNGFDLVMELPVIIIANIITFYALIQHAVDVEQKNVQMHVLDHKIGKNKWG